MLGNRVTHCIRVGIGGRTGGSEPQAHGRRNTSLIPFTLDQWQIPLSLESQNLAPGSSYCKASGKTHGEAETPLLEGHAMGTVCDQMLQRRA